MMFDFVNNIGYEKNAKKGGARINAVTISIAVLMGEIVRYCR